MKGNKLFSNSCSICGDTLEGASCFVGTGTGAMVNGGSFAHKSCYDLRELQIKYKNLKETVEKIRNLVE